MTEPSVSRTAHPPLTHMRLALKKLHLALAAIMCFLVNFSMAQSMYCCKHKNKKTLLELDYRVPDVARSQVDVLVGFD